MRLTAIDAREMSTDRPGGFRSYAEAVVRSLREHPNGLDYAFYTDREMSGVETRVCRPTQLVVREQFALPRALIRDRVSVCHFLANTAPLRCPVPYALTLHDTFCMQRPTADILANGTLRNKALSLYSKYLPSVAAKRARRLITVSSHAADRISRLLRLPRERIAVIAQSLHPRFRPGSEDALRADLRSRLGAEFVVLIIGTPEPRKNLPTMLAAVSRAQGENPRLGLAMTWSARMQLGDWLKQTGALLPERSMILSGLSDDDLAAHYRAVDALLFASLDEGFGLPVVEAMACGCAVITSDASCLPETSGGAAYLVDPESVESIANAIAALVDDPEMRAGMVSRGIARASELTPDRMAAALAAVYRECIDYSPEAARR